VIAYQLNQDVEVLISFSHGPHLEGEFWDKGTIVRLARAPDQGWVVQLTDGPVVAVFDEKNIRPANISWRRPLGLPERIADVRAGPGALSAQAK
jgi:hypothetical protein